jgi:formylmethanofuran dehydrogenase subunit E
MAMDQARAVIRRLDRGAAEGTLVACSGCRRWVSMATVTQVGDRPVCPGCADGDLP